MIVFDTTNARTPADATFCERSAANAPPSSPLQQGPPTPAGN
jgi:hypothetical protein